MRLTDNVKNTRLHRLYLCGLWLGVSSASAVFVFSAFTSYRIQAAMLSVPAGDPTFWWMVRRMNAYNNAMTTSVFALLALALLPLLYRTTLYIIHGKAAFRPRAAKKSHRIPSDDTEQNRNNDPFTVLGVARNASYEEIKRAYRTKMREYHPDKVAGLGEDLRNLAERKAKEAKEINEAFETLSKMHDAA